MKAIFVVLAMLFFVTAVQAQCPQTAKVQCPSVQTPGSDECPGSESGTAKGHSMKMSKSCAEACAKAAKLKKTSAAAPYHCLPCMLLGCGSNY